MLGKKGTGTKPLIEQMGKTEKSLLECLGLPLKKMNSDSTTDSVKHVTMRMTLSKVCPNEHTTTRTSMTCIMHGTGEPQGGEHHGCIRQILPMLKKPASSGWFTT